ncbi:MAG: SsrA-binding protein SmpB [Candidatus Omnitrophota bacterium]
MEERVIATNRKLYRDYEVLETFECGIELKGSEVKSLREAKATIDDAFGRIEASQVYLYNCHIQPYEKASYFKEEATRPRRLLLHKPQIRKLIGQITQRGFTLAPYKLYFNSKGLVKVAMSLVRGKKSYDRREDIKKRDTDREMRRSIRRK